MSLHRFIFSISQDNLERWCICFCVSDGQRPKKTPRDAIMNRCSEKDVWDPQECWWLRRVNLSPTSQPHPLVLPDLNSRVVHYVLEIPEDLAVQIWLCLFSVLPSSREWICCCSAQRHLGPEVYTSPPHVTKPQCDKYNQWRDGKSFDN